MPRQAVITSVLHIETTSEAIALENSKSRRLYSRDHVVVPRRTAVTRMKLTCVFRTPQYPVLCEVPGDVVAARSKQQLERRLAKLPLPAGGTLPMVDASGEGWGVHLELSAISPLVLKRKWTKADVLRLYRDSATGRRRGLPWEEKSLLRQRFDQVLLRIVDLVTQRPHFRSE